MITIKRTRDKRFLLSIGKKKYHLSALEAMKLTLDLKELFGDNPGFLKRIYQGFKDIKKKRIITVKNLSKFLKRL